MNKNVFRSSFDLAQGIVKYASVGISGVWLFATALQRPGLSAAQQGYVVGSAIGLCIGLLILFKIVSVLVLEVRFANSPITLSECMECLRCKTDKDVHHFALEKLGKFKTPDAFLALLEVAQNEDIETTYRKQALSMIKKFHKQKLTHESLATIDNIEQNLKGKPDDLRTCLPIMLAAIILVILILVLVFLSGARPR